MFIPSKTTNDTLSASEFMQIRNELQNFIGDKGLSASAGDVFQISEAVAQAAADGNFFTDAGTDTTYVLSPHDQANNHVNSYTAGMVVRFIADNTNTGSSTCQITGLAAQPIVTTYLGGTSLSGGEIFGYTSLIYDGASFSPLEATGSPSLDFIAAASSGATTNDHVLVSTGLSQMPAALSNGMRFRYLPAANSVAGNVTVKIGSLAAIEVSINPSSTTAQDFIVDEIGVGVLFEVEYSTASSRFFVVQNTSPVTATNVDYESRTASAAAVKTNADLIAQNISDIATNTGDIATNTSDISALPTLSSGTFIPTIPVDTECTVSLTNTSHTFIRVGNQVTISGNLFVDVALATSDCSFEMEISDAPTDQNFTDIIQASGVAQTTKVGTANDEQTTISSISGGTRILFNVWEPSSNTGSLLWCYVAQYQIIP